VAGGVIDLSTPCSNGTEGFRVRKQEDLPVYLGHECYAYDLEIKSHTGTYFETSAHLFRDGRNTESVPAEELILPGACLRIATDDRCIHARDLEDAYCGLLDGTALLIDTGQDRTKYFSSDSARWMASKNIKLMGSTALLYDCGFKNPTGFFVDLFEARIPIVANLLNVDQLPEAGFTLIVLPLRIQGVCTAPCRVVAVLGEKNNPQGR